ncbi:MAG: hypothetical protein N4A38_04280 [Candidatus Gracilibacteria bacterium]|nr:hypothetical protein [Candidatus Gracilibacteria bacterium]
MKKLTTIIFLMFSLLLVNSVNASLLEANNETGSGKFCTESGGKLSTDLCIFDGDNEISSDALYNAHQELTGQVGFLGGSKYFDESKGAYNIDLIKRDLVTFKFIKDNKIKTFDMKKVDEEIKNLENKLDNKTKNKIGYVPQDVKDKNGNVVGQTRGLVGGDRDEHGCIGSAGYMWSEFKKECVRPWEQIAPKEELKKCVSYFDGCNTCTVTENGKLGACTLMACEVLGEPKCLKERSFIIGKVTKIEQGKDGFSTTIKYDTNKTFIATFSIPNMGPNGKYFSDIEVGDELKIYMTEDEKKKPSFIAVRHFEYTDKKKEKEALEKTEKQNKESTMIEDNKLIGGDRDEHGCIGSAGYTWNEEKQKCTRPWEDKKEISENDKNFYNHIKDTLDKKYSDLEQKLIKQIEAKTGRMSKSIKQKYLNDFVNKLENLISGHLAKYPQDTALPEKANNIYLTLELLKLDIQINLIK